MSPPPLDWQVSKQPEPSEHHLRAEPVSQSPTWAYSSLLSHSILLRIKIQLKKKEKKRRKVFVGSATAPGLRGTAQVSLRPLSWFPMRTFRHGVFICRNLGGQLDLGAREKSDTQWPVGHISAVLDTQFLRTISVSDLQIPERDVPGRL